MWNTLKAYEEARANGERPEHPYTAGQTEAARSYFYGRSKDETVHVEPADIIIVEGILIFTCPKLMRQMDIKVYVDADDDWREPQFDSQESLMVLCGWDREKLLTL